MSWKDNIFAQNYENILSDQKNYARVATDKKLMEKELQIASNIPEGILRGKTNETQPVVLRVPNTIDQWPVLRAALQNYGMCVGVEARTLKKMVVALEEAVVNVINYSQADYISLTIDQGPLTITLTDNGIAFDPTACPEVDTDQVVAERQIGGLGIALLRQIADKIEYRRTDGQNVLIITKNI